MYVFVRVNLSSSLCAGVRVGAPVIISKKHATISNSEQVPYVLTPSDASVANGLEICYHNLFTFE